MTFDREVRFCRDFFKMKGSVVELLWTFLRKFMKVTGILTFLDSGGFIYLRFFGGSIDTLGVLCITVNFLQFPNIEFQLLH
jgi:hypothetical protein